LAKQNGLALNACITMYVKALLKSRW